MMDNVFLVQVHFFLLFWLEIHKQSSTEMFPIDKKFERK